MPIEGRFYESEELQLFLGVTKQRITNLFGECAIKPGLYPSEVVEPHLRNKGIRPETLPVRTHANPDGATWEQLEAEHDAAQAAGVAFREKINK